MCKDATQAIRPDKRYHGVDHADLNALPHIDCPAPERKNNQIGDDVDRVSNQNIHDRLKQAVSLELHVILL